jgi:transcriptional regulator with XRE-family HTH domain
MPRSTTTRTSLGMLVRQKRESMRLSMDDLANRARVSRSTLHRIEHDHKTRPTAPKLAQILVVLEIEADEILAVLHDADYASDVLHWMERSAAFSDAARALRPRVTVAGEAPDLIAMKDGSTAEIRGASLDELKDALKAAGWLVMRPD